MTIICKSLFFNHYFVFGVLCAQNRGHGTVNRQGTQLNLLDLASFLDIIGLNSPTMTKQGLETRGYRTLKGLLS